ncbi:MAG: hypothetical protein UH788_08335 [Treponemataceae bacterium]|nr:hypothetical protein [Treponemataceae bacterium]
MRDKIICILMLFISFNIFAYERVDLTSENPVDKIYVDKIIQNYFWDDYDSTRLIKTYSEIEGNFIKEYYFYNVDIFQFRKEAKNELRCLGFRCRDVVNFTNDVLFVNTARIKGDICYIKLDCTENDKNQILYLWEGSLNSTEENKSTFGISMNNKRSEFQLNTNISKLKIYTLDKNIKITKIDGYESFVGLREVQFENFENVNLKKLENPVWFKITFNNCKNVNIKKINQNISNLEKWFFENDYTRVLENSIATLKRNYELLKLKNSKPFEYKETCLIENTNIDFIYRFDSVSKEMINFHVLASCEENGNTFFYEKLNVNNTKADNKIILNGKFTDENNNIVENPVLFLWR